MKKPLLLKRKRCLSCRKLFDLNPRTKNHQHYCSKAECQAIRQRKNEKDWYWRNPDCVADQKRKWQQKHPGYSQQRRVADPAMADKNRQDTKIRMQQIRWEDMFDKSKPILTQVVGRNTDNCCLMRGNWLFLRLTRASLWLKAAVMRHTGKKLKRVANRLPKSRLYDLSGMIKGASSHG